MVTHHAIQSFRRRPVHRLWTWQLVAGLLLTAVVYALALSQVAHAQPARPADPVAPVTGGLTAYRPDGKPIEFPLRHTDVEIGVSGFLARATVTQTFANPSKTRIEAVYVFPLPENAAVDDMTMQIGSRTIRGLIKERREAQQIYDAAKAQGKTASLLTQERPNIFTQAVANILPGDTIRITISYTQYLKYEKGTLSMAFPMVVGPRYIPGASYAADGTVTPVPGARQSVPDADRITPPVMKPGTRSGHDIAVTVNLDAGVPFKGPYSKSHEVAVTRVSPSSALVRLDPADSIPNKDFMLEWTVDPERVATGVLAHRTDDEGFVTLMMVPGVDPRPADVTPKEMVFVVDCSGSQMGAPIEQEKMLVRWALAHLNPSDSFQILIFSNTASGMSPLPIPNTPENVKRALAYLDSLHGEGGTEMIAGIKAALDFPPDPDRMRVVMFLTDGYIGNETEILAAIRQRIGDARLFPLGVGSSVNRYLMENMALEGRGSVQYIRPDENAAPPIAKFYDQIRSPVLTDVEIDWGGLEVRGMLPARVPDVFAGHPVLVTAKYARSGTAVVKVKGRIAGERVELPVQVTLPEKESRNTVLRALWARAEIDGLMNRMLKGEDPAIVKQVIATSVRHRVLSQYTAFVAVEEKVRTNERGDPVKVEVPVELPDMTQYEGFFGEDGDGVSANLVAADKSRAQHGAPAKGARIYTSAPMMLKAAEAKAPPPVSPATRSGTLHGQGMGGGGSGAGYGSGTASGHGRVVGTVSGRSAGSYSIGLGGAAVAATPAGVPVALAEAAPDKGDREAVEKAMSVTLTVVSVSGSLAPAATEKTLAAAVATLKRCLAFARSSGKALPSSLVFVVKSDSQGKVVSAAIENAPATLDASLKLCLERAFRTHALAAAGEARVRIDIRM
jgi:Ca-activated chloride channel family protein